MLTDHHKTIYLILPAAFREAHARLKGMVEEAELRKKQARALAAAQEQQQGLQRAWADGADEQDNGTLLQAPPAAAVLVSNPEEDRLMRSLLRRACPLVRRKGKILHELQVRR